MIRIGLLILLAAMMLVGCGAVVDNDLNYSISKQRHITVYTKKDSNGKFTYEISDDVKITRHKLRVVETAIKDKLESLPTPKTGDVIRTTIRFKERVKIQNLFAEGIRNPHDGKTILKRFIENRIVGDYVYGRDYMPSIRGEIGSSRETTKSYDFTLAQALLPSHVHKTNSVVVRVLKEKLSDEESKQILKTYKRGVKIKCEGFLSREGNSIIIDAQGIFEKVKPYTTTNGWSRINRLDLGLTIEAIYRENAEPIGHTNIGPIEVVD